MVRTYKEAGVDMDKQQATIAALVKQLKFQRRGAGRSLSLPGHFVGLIDMGTSALTLTTDNVGTKSLVATAMRKWDTIGIDCVAVNVNDTICVGAEPLAMVDYYAVERYDPDMAKQVGIGLNRGAKEANITIIGGESACIPEIVTGYDIAGTCVGTVKKSDLITGSRIRDGDAILGLRSTGIHANGYTLVRRVLQSAGVTYDEKLPGTGERIGDVLLTPTRIYVKPVLDAVRRCEVHGMAHVSGGGLRNLVRLKKGVQFKITDPWEPQPIFRYLQELGGIENSEMYQTFNMGMGMALVVARRDVEEALKRLAPAEPKIVGEVVKGTGVYCPPAGVRYERY